MPVQPDPLHTLPEALPVKLSSLPRQYSVQTGNNCLPQLGNACRAVIPPDAKILLLTDTIVAPHYEKIVRDSLLKAGYTAVVTCTIPAGEHSKTIEQARQIYTLLVNAGFTRKDAILGLGGGVVGDLAGYSASTYHRGMGLVHVPTSLVAQVDSALGGKTAVNFAAVKNMVGTFYQPLLVYSDAAVLETLPPDEWSAGMAEVIKYGLIESSCVPGQTGFFEWLCQHAMAGTLKENTAALITRCCALKIAVIEADEFETKGIRFFLNLGHTFGHAYEALSHEQQNHPPLLHGEAVAIGMIKAVQLSVQLGLFPPSVLPKLTALYQGVGLAHCLCDPFAFEAGALLKKMKHDKKNRDDLFIQLVLPNGRPGQVCLKKDVPESVILDVLRLPG
jgi:3-dehydroquinate synthase